MEPAYASMCTHTVLQGVPVPQLKAVKHSAGDLKTRQCGISVHLGDSLDSKYSASLSDVVSSPDSGLTDT